MRRVEAANRSVTVTALNLVPEFAFMFETNLMIQILTAVSQYTPLLDVPAALCS